MTETNGIVNKGPGLLEIFEEVRVAFQVPWHALEPEEPWSKVQNYTHHISSFALSVVHTTCGLHKAEGRFWFTRRPICPKHYTGELPNIPR